MAVTSTFQRDRVGTVPNAPTALSLRLYNDSGGRREVALEPSGDLAPHVTLAPTSVTLDTNEIVDVAVTVEVPVTTMPGAHPVAVHVTSHPVPVPGGGPDATPPGGTDGAVDDLTVTATVDVGAVTAFAQTLSPDRSRGSTAGRHRIRVTNSGNVGVSIDFTPEVVDDTIDVAVALPTLTIGPGATEETFVRVTPSATYWSGPTTLHEFAIRALGSDGSIDELRASYLQRPRLPNWVGPAVAGAFIALVVGAIVWLTLLRPWVETTADDAAADAIEADREALQERIAELEAAAAEAEELPLGAPTDVVLSVAPTAGVTESASDAVRPGERVSVTDIVFQNPTGGVGTVMLKRDDEVLLESELANFRDFDLHLVAPFVFEQSEQIVLEVDCRTAGAGASGNDCPVSMTIVGFADEID